MIAELIRNTATEEAVFNFPSLPPLVLHIQYVSDIVTTLRPDQVKISDICHKDQIKVGKVVTISDVCLKELAIISDTYRTVASPPSKFLARPHDLTQLCNGED